MKKSYIQLLKEAASGDYTTNASKVDVKGPMLDNIIGYDGKLDGYETNKKTSDAASILERYYFKEQESDTKIDNPVNDEPDTEPVGDIAASTDGKGGDASMDQIEKDIAGETSGTLKEDDEEHKEEGEDKEEDKEGEDKEDKEDDKEVEKVSEAIRMLMESEMKEGGTPLKVVGKGSSNDDNDSYEEKEEKEEKKELTAENAILSKLIEQMEADSKIDGKEASDEPDTEPAGDPAESKDGKGGTVEDPEKKITKEHIEEMFQMFREQVEAEEKEEEEDSHKEPDADDKKDASTEDNDEDEDDTEKKLSELESFFMEDDKISSKDTRA